MVPTIDVTLGTANIDPRAASSVEICEYDFVMLKAFWEAAKIAGPP
jgi:hypothetical protein